MTTTGIHEQSDHPRQICSNRRRHHQSIYHLRYCHHHFGYNPCKVARLATLQLVASSSTTITVAVSVACLTTLQGNVAKMKMVVAEVVEIMAVLVKMVAAAAVATNMVRMVTLHMNALVVVVDRGFNHSYVFIFYGVIFFVFISS
uniref:Transmembrane protein n=1 Tax=Solanum lycopersicum TaxID=4081 RepID=A0A3Q7J4M5_SOLLC